MELEQIKLQIYSPDLQECLRAVRALDSFDPSLLINFFDERRTQNNPIDFIDGAIYQTLLKMNDQTLRAKMIEGLNLADATIDLIPLFNLLSLGEYQQADVFHNQKMCEAAGTDRGWLYFTEVVQISLKDLQTIDRLWVVFSDGKFGYSVQRKLWLNLGKNWEKLWKQIHWKQEGSFTRYPGGFIWSLAAPRGHLPLSNQIRGNKTLEAIFNLFDRTSSNPGGAAHP